MLQKPNWPDSLQRWNAFWNGKVADRPPVIAHVDPSGGMAIGAAPTLDDTLVYYDPARNGAHLEAIERAILTPAELEDDSPPSAMSGGGVWFTGAVFNAPIRATANMMVTDPIIEDWSQLDEWELCPNAPKATSLTPAPLPPKAGGEGGRGLLNLSSYLPNSDGYIESPFSPFPGFSLASPWVQRALGLAAQWVERSGGRYAVTAGLLEGPSDICGNLRGTTRLAGDLAEYPERVRQFADMAADAWRQFTRAMFDVIPLYDGGTATQWALWTPGRGAALQEDFCTLLSPRQYREFFPPYDRALAREVDVAWMHVHAGEIHIVDEILTAKEIHGVQIVHDGVASPDLLRMVPVMLRVQAAGKCLILRKFPIADLDAILPHLSMRRLALDVYFPTAEEGSKWIKGLERWAK